MFYKFPHLTHVDQVKKAIEGRDEFFVAERDGYQVANYMVALHTSFLPVTSEDEAIIRECRGLIFDRDGLVVARRFQKFFNINEREETLYENIDFSVPHVILEKLDGSMVTPIMVNGDLRWGTKMGITDGFSDMVEDFVFANPQYTFLAFLCWNQDTTPIFEWCSRKSRIVVDHPEDRLVLTAIRNNLSGEYMPYSQMAKLAIDTGIDCVKAYEGTVEGMMELARTQEEGEGWVIRFENGHMLKIKTDAYCAIHKAKSMITSEKAVIELIVNQGIDDLLPILYKEDADKIRAFHDAFWHNVQFFVHSLFEVFAKMKLKYPEKRDFAMGVAMGIDPLTRSMLFRCYDTIDPNDPSPVMGMMEATNEIVIDRIKKSLSTNRKIDENRIMWGNLKWSYNATEDRE